MVLRWEISSPEKLLAISAVSVSFVSAPIPIALLTVEDVESGSYVTLTKGKTVRLAYISYKKNEPKHNKTKTIKSWYEK